MIYDVNGHALVAVLECQGESEALVALGYLETFGLVGRLNSELPQEVMPFTVDGLGKVQILVQEDMAKQAKSILDERLRSEANETED